MFSTFNFCRVANAKIGLKPFNRWKSVLQVAKMWIPATGEKKKKEEKKTFAEFAICHNNKERKGF